MNLGIKNLYNDSILVYTGEDIPDLDLKGHVIFTEENSLELIGQVVFVDRKKLGKTEAPFRGKILRVATKADLKKLQSLSHQANETLGKVREKVNEMELPMQIVEIRLAFDESEVNLIFTAEERIDFKEVVPRLAGLLKKRVHLTQIGLRDRAKLIPGYGVCGQMQCCSAGVFKEFQSITMEMAKKQELIMKGSEKLSGNCGKLLCCLQYELEEYERMRKTLPPWGSQVQTEKGPGKVIALDILNQKIKVWLEKGGAQTFPAETVKALKNNPPRIMT